MIIKWQLLLVAIVVYLLGTLQLADGKSNVLRKRICDPGSKNCKGQQAGRQLDAAEKPAIKETEKPLNESVVDKIKVADNVDLVDIQPDNNENHVDVDNNDAQEVELNDIQANDNEDDVAEDNDVAHEPTDELDSDKMQQPPKDEGKSSIARRIRRRLRMSRRRRTLFRNKQRRRIIQRRNRLRRNRLERNRRRRNRISRLAGRLARRRRIRNG